MSSEVSHKPGSEPPGLDSGPDPEARQILALLDGFRASKAVFTAVSLGVFDRLHERPAACADLADALGVQAWELERLLGACVGLGFLRIEYGQYRNQPAASRFLRVESPETLSGYILYSDRVLYRLWGRLEDAVREGGHRWEQEFGSKIELFDNFFATEQDKVTFLAGMHGAGLLSSPSTVAVFDLGRFHHLVDVGGGTGHLAIEACRRYAGLRATVFDLPEVCPVARGYIHDAGLAGRIETVAGDFFRDPLPPADLYSMGRILHDWGDEQVSVLLGKVCEALPADGGLLVCEKLLNEERDGPADAYLQSLNMLVCTEGRERSASEYEALVKAAGFRTFQFKRTGRPVDAMLALK